MKKWLVVFLCCFISSAFAQKVDITEYSQNMALKDTAALDIHDADNVTAPRGMITETYQIPGYELYDQYWDVENLRSHKLEIPFADDRLMLLLVQASNNAFQMPCVFDEISLPFGMTKQGIFHPGIDLKVDVQTLVKCCFDGVVRMAKYYGQYGKVVVVRHYNGLETVYAHLDKICVRPGQLLNAGDVIGQTGQTGNSSESILHFEIRFMNEYFNPEFVIDFENETLIKNTLVLRPSDFKITDMQEIMPPQPVSPPSQDVQTPKPSPSTTIPQPQSSPTPEYHTVTAGETLYRISINYNISIDKLKELNHLQNGDVIQSGQKLRVR